MDGTVVVTGAAGYIGSIVAERLLGEGYTVIGLDNLKQGHREALDDKVQFLRGDLEDPALLDRIFSESHVSAVMHFAASSIVPESMANPAAYFRNNVVSGLNLLNAMVKHNVKRLVFSSSAAVYGVPVSIPIEEKAQVNPVNPYGEAKLFFERALKWYAHAYGLGSVSLRYFNAAGASDLHGEHHNPETHLIPNVLRIAMSGSGHVSIFGKEYDTPDGTCVRDYVHVLDIADAHLKALPETVTAFPRIYNLGSSRGHSVLEVVRTAESVTGVSIPVVFGPPREGDPPALVASSGLAREELGWTPTHSELREIVESAWKWQTRFPAGYSG